MVVCIPILLHVYYYNNLSVYLQLCQSYPQSVLVPKSVTDDMLAKIAGFRQNGRFPFLSYYHKDSKVRTRFLLPIIINSLAFCYFDVLGFSCHVGLFKSAENVIKEQINWLFTYYAFALIKKDSKIVCGNYFMNSWVMTNLRDVLC